MRDRAAGKCATQQATAADGPPFPAAAVGREEGKRDRSISVKHSERTSISLNHAATNAKIIKCAVFNLQQRVRVRVCVQQLHMDMEPLATTTAAMVPPPSRSSSNSKPQDAGTLTREDFDGGPVSIDEVETGLFLGKHKRAYP